MTRTSWTDSTNKRLSVIAGEWMTYDRLHAERQTPLKSARAFKLLGRQPD